MMLAASLRAASDLKLLDDPNKIARPAPPILKLVGNGEIDRAAQAGVKHEEQRSARQRAHEFFAREEREAMTGTDSTDAIRRPSTLDPLGDLAQCLMEESNGNTGTQED
jgi:hypothetical protein